MLRKGLVAAGLVSMLSLPASAGVWVSQASPTIATLYAVACSDSATWVAVGDGGVIVRSIDGGVNWSPISSPVGDALRGVAFHGDVGIAVGIGGRIVRTIDAGLNWSVIARPTTKILWAVSLGDSMFVITGEEGRIFVSLDGGISWAPHFSGSASSFFGVSVSGTVGVTAGGAGAISMSVDKGAGWGLTVLGSQNTFCYGVSMVSPQTGWAVGTDPSGVGLIIRTDLSGFTWTGQSVPAAGILFGVSFSAGDTGSAVGESGVVVHTDDGQHWFTQPSGTSATLNGVSFFRPGLGIAVGGGGTILRASSDVVAAVGPGGAGPPRLALRVLDSRGGPSRGMKFAVELPADAPTSLRVLDVSGRVITTLADEAMAAGTHELAWGGQAANGSAAPVGVYFASLNARGERTSAKFVVWR